MAARRAVAVTVAGSRGRRVTLKNSGMRLKAAMWAGMRLKAARVADRMPSALENGGCARRREAGAGGMRGRRKSPLGFPEGFRKGRDVGMRAPLSIGRTGAVRRPPGQRGYGSSRLTRLGAAIRRDVTTGYGETFRHGATVRRCEGFAGGRELRLAMPGRDGPRAVAMGLNAVRVRKSHVAGVSVERLSRCGMRGPLAPDGGIAPSLSVPGGPGAVRGPPGVGIKVDRQRAGPGSGLNAGQEILGRKGGRIRLGEGGKGSGRKARGAGRPGWGRSPRTRRRRSGGRTRGRRRQAPGRSSGGRRRGVRLGLRNPGSGRCRRR
jgi:hypothetical protein